MDEEESKESPGEEEEDQMRPIFQMSIKAQPRYIDTDEDDQEQFADLPRQDEEEEEEEEEFERAEEDEEDEGFNTYAQEIRDRLDQYEETDNYQEGSSPETKDAETE